MAFFKSNGAGAVVITNGARDICLYASGERFAAIETTLPVSEAVAGELKKGSRGDTTGCGDNFAGGVIASVVAQLGNESKRLDLLEACRWGVVSGGFACFYMGGTWFEKYPGEKRALITPYYEKYLKQTGFHSKNTIYNIQNIQ
jgi:sugar/nucleoside kinase (ribokinase family)